MLTIVNLYSFLFFTFIVKNIFFLSNYLNESKSPCYIAIKEIVYIIKHISAIFKSLIIIYMLIYTHFLVII